MDKNSVMIVMCVVAFFYGMLLLKPLACGLEQLRKMPKGMLVVLLSFVFVAVVEADKTNSPPRMLLRQILGLQVSQEDIARGYRLDRVTTNVGHSASMPTNAFYLGNAHVRGAASGFGRNRLDFGDWSFPHGPDGASYTAVWWFNDGRIRMRPLDSAGEIATGARDVLAVQGLSRIWWAAGDSGERIVGWENVFPNSDTNESADLQIVLRQDGGFETWSNGVAHAYERIDPCDWDGDGLYNFIDPEPTVCGGNCFGTGVDWLNANCSAVLSSVADTNGEPVVVWHTNVCEVAYYWLEFTALADATHVTIDCDGTSNLGNLAVIAMSNQVCRVPLLMGPSYHVSASSPLCDVSASDSAAEIASSEPMRGGAFGPSADFTVQRHVSLGFTGTAPNLLLSSAPYVGASISCFIGGCCQAVFDGVTLTWVCGPDCSCGGFSHGGIGAAATWEGYTQNFLWEQSCQCQENNKENPETWFGMSAPSVVMLHGDMGTLHAEYGPYGEQSGTVTLRCSSGAGKVALWTDTNRVQAVSLPMTWSASMESEATIFIEGIGVSGSVGDVVFEYELALDAKALVRLPVQ